MTELGLESFHSVSVVAATVLAVLAPSLRNHSPFSVLHSWHLFQPRRGFAVITLLSGDQFPIEILVKL